MESIIKVQLKRQVDRSYDVIIGFGLLKKIEAVLKDLPRAHNYVIITDSFVKKLYGNALRVGLERKGCGGVHLLFFQAGEKSKNQNTATILQNKMLERGCGRDTIVLALGGGVVGDLAGYVAATFMRGVPYIQIPTTLLAMVDSSIGGKTGIDTPYGKNLIGAFWQPLRVVADIDTVLKLPDKQYYNGLYEAIKVFITHDKEAFQFVEDNISRIKTRDNTVLRKVIESAVKIKTKVVSRDEYDTGERALINFGHTIGHSLEHLSEFKLPHGYAVALGIIVECGVAVYLGKLSNKVYKRICDLLSNFYVNIDDIKQFKPADIIKITRIDKKAKAGKACYVLLKDIGRVCRKNGGWAHEVEDKIVKKTLMSYCG